MAVEVWRRRFTVDEYYRMADAGILNEDDQVELIEGEIVEMAPIGSRHAGHVDRLNQLFSRRVADRAIVRVQNPIWLSDYTEPQPDISLLRPRSDFYTSAHPRPQDVLLVVEVADTSIDYDREVKAPLYARLGIGEFWLVDLVRESIEVYRRPSPEGYLEVRRTQRGEGLAPEAFPDLELSVDDVLGPAS